MCISFGGGRVRQAADPLPPVAPPPPPVAQTIAGPPSVAIPEEIKMQKKVKTYASRRRAAAGGITGKRVFTIPRFGGSEGGSGVNY